MSEENYYLTHGVGPTRPVTPNPIADAIVQRFIEEFNHWSESLNATQAEREFGVLSALTLAFSATEVFHEEDDKDQLALWEAIKERIKSPQPDQPLTMQTTTNRSGVEPDV